MSDEQLIEKFRRRRQQMIEAKDELEKLGYHFETENGASFYWAGFKIFKYEKITTKLEQTIKVYR
jgi:uncharacterized protein YktA (UPF0223 family)